MNKEEKVDYKAKIRDFLQDWVGKAKKLWWIYLVEIAVIAVILVADLLTKKYAWEYLATYGCKEDIIKGLVNLVEVKNSGGGFGLFEGRTIGLVVITFIVLAGILVYQLLTPAGNKWLRVSLTFIIGGGIGNNVDRIAFGYVRDFIQFAFWEKFPAFNIADSFITVGMFMLIAVLIVMLVQEGKKNQAEFEKEQESKPQSAQDYIDPLDAPQCLNPMLKSENEFTFDEPTTEQVEQKAENAQDESADSVANNSVCEQGENAAQELDGQDISEKSDDKASKE